MATKIIRVFQEFTIDGYVPFSATANLDFGVTVANTFPGTTPATYQTDDPDIEVDVTTMTDFYVWIRGNGQDWNINYTRNVRVYPDSPDINNVVMGVIIANLPGIVPYEGATQDVDIRPYGLYTQFVQFNDTVPVFDYPTDSGTIYYDVDDETLNLIGIGGTVQQIGQEIYYPKVSNQTGSTIPNGTLVMVNPAQIVQGDKLNIIPAVTDGTYSADLVLGLATQDIVNNGMVTWFGYVRDITTTNINKGGETWAVGNILYGDPANAGGLTNVEPTAPNHKSKIAVITKIDGSTVTLMVRPTLGQHLYELHDVDINTIADNQGLIWDATNQRWENRNVVVDSGYIPLSDGDEYGNSVLYENLGFIGLNTTNPLFELDINGDIRIQSGGSYYLGSTAYTIASASNSGFLTSTDWNTFNNKQDAIFDILLPVNGEGLYYNSTSGLWENMPLLVVANYIPRATSGGYGVSKLYDNGTNVGVNTTTPAYLFDVNGDINTSGVYRIGGVDKSTLWNTAYDNMIVSAGVSGTTTKTLTLTQQDGGTIVASWTDYDTAPVTSVFGRTGIVIAQSGDYSTTLVTEGTNLYYTDARARASLSFSAGSGAYNSATGVITIPTNNNQITNGAGYITGINSSMVTTALGYTPVPNTRTLTINGTAYDLSADRSWTIAGTIGGLTTNYIPKATSSTTLGNSLIYDNGTSVAINTSIPFFNSKLQVNQSTTGGIISNFYDSASDQMLYSYATNSGSIGFQAHNSAGLVVKNIFFNPSGGNVLIGTTSDSGYKLDVNGDGHFKHTNTPIRLDNLGGNITQLDFLNNGVQKGAIWWNNSTNTLNLYSGVTAMTITSAGLVGINTTPSTTLHINGGTSTGLTITGTTESYINFGDADNNVGQIYYGHSNNTMVFRTNDGNRMYLNSSGYLGIGTSNPEANLHIYGTSAGVIRLSSTSYSYQLYTNESNSSLIFRDVNNTINRMTLDSNGNFGIGITTPSYKLDVNGTGRFSSTSLIIQNTNSYSALEVTDGTNTGYFGYAYANTHYTNNSLAGDSIIRGVNGIAFGSGNGAYGMRLDSSGRLGIGTSAPSYKLDVNGDGRFNNTVILNRNSTSVSSCLRFATNGTNEWFVGTNALGTNLTNFYFYKYGLGTVLDLSSSTGQATFSNSVTAGNLVSIKGIYPYVQFLNTSDARQGYIQHDLSNLVIASDVGALIFNVPTERMRITSGGNVGIGTTSPSAKLHIYESSANNSELKITSTYADGYDAQLTLENTHTGGRIYELLSTNNSRGYIGGGKFVINDKTAGDSVARFVIDSSGNVGIGTTAPSAKLEVNGNIYTTSNTNFLLFGTNAAVNPYIQGGSDNSIYIGTGGSARISITSGGNVGIGTTAPAYKMHISSSSAEVMRLQGTNGGSTNNTQLRFFGSYSNTDLWAIGTEVSTGSTDRAFDFYDLVSGVNRMRITSGGNVGIGTSNPQALLHVASSIRSQTIYGGTYTAHDGTNSVNFGSYYNTIGTGNSYDGVISVSNASGNFMYLIGGTERMRITSTGNVGIGTSAPSEKLDVSGNISVSSYTGSKIGFNTTDSFTAYGYSAAHYGLSYYTSANPVVLSGYYGIGFYTFGSQRMLITSGGNIGINTSSPFSYQNYRYLTITGGATNQGGIVRLTTSDSSYTNEFAVDSTGGYINTNSNFFLYAGSSSIRMYISGSTGNVGIGTTSPSYKLDVAGHIRGENIYIDNSSGTGGIFRIDGYQNYLYIYGSTSNILGYRFGSDTAGIKMSINTSGRVLIGTTSEWTGGDAPLQIYATTNPQITYTTGQSSQRWVSGLAGSDGSAYNIYDITNDRRLISARTDNTVIIGNAGVSGGGMLQVNGDVNINGNFKINGTTIGGGGGSGVTGSGTTNTIPKWTSSSALGNSIITEATNNSITINGPYLNIISGGYPLNFYVNTSNGIMSIGKSPSFAIHMNQSNLVGINTTSFQSGNTLTCDGNAYFIGVVSASSYVTLSDIRLKTDVVELDKGLNEIIQLAPKSYKKDNSAEYGLIAQEVESILPQLVHNKNTYKSLKYMELIPIMVNAIKELKAELDELKK